MASGETEAGKPSSRSELLPVVGIGASAGGLAALKELFRNMPSDSGLAFVVVVHLSPKHESHLPDLLQTHTKMPVTQVAETVQMEPNHVYVIPPGANLTAVDTHLRLSELEEERNRRAPIDHFFETLAEAHHRTAIGVVLTGTGSDGTLGLQKIRERGGLTIAQDPVEAEYDAMPQNAVSRGVVDRVLALSEMPEQIVRFATSEPVVPVLDQVEEIGRNGREKILTQVRARTGHDFSRYKPATLMRRIHRRMQLQQIENLEEYAERLRSDHDEVEQLFEDLLITVTTFFRDPQTFAVLKRSLIPTLFEGKSEQDQVRAWSVGCATGEEAYSLAILLLEHASRLDRPPKIQIFATDLRESSLRCARAGLYPDTIEADIPPERLERFFVRENDHYRIRPEVRDTVVFAPHNVMADPPFSHLDLISCRNMLIYLQREGQEEIISLFHYALRPGGYLLLGSSETIEHSELFRRTDKSHRIYRRREVPAQEPRLPVFSLPAPRFARRDLDVLQRARGAPDAGTLHLTMVEQYAPPSVLVNEDHALVHSSAQAKKYLTVPAGEPTNDVFRLVREPLRLVLRAGLLAARDRKEAHRSKPVRLEVGGETAHVMVRVHPADDDELANLYLVIFDEVPAPESGEAGEEGAPEGRVQELEEELTAARAHLQAVIGEHETSQEEMQASNEELQSINEELRSTTEELETSKEELQSMNEELATVNQENRYKVEELAQLSSDLQNLLSATDVATLFLDRQLRIMRFTPPLTELFNVRPADRGRPISDLTHRLGDIAVESDAQQVLDSLVPLKREVRSVDERWFLTNITPYRSTEDRIEGVVITFVDITERKEAEEAIQEAKIYAESIVETLHEPLIVLTPDLRVQSANEAFYEHFEVERKATIGRKIYELGNGQWDIPGLRELLEDVLPSNDVFTDFEVRHEFQDIGERIMLVNARRLDHVQLILLGIRDITERKRSEEKLRRNEQRLKRMVNVPRVGVLTFDYEGNLLYANDAVLEMLGHDREKFEGESLTWRDFTPPGHGEAGEHLLNTVLETGAGVPYEKEYVREDGSRLWLMLVAADLGDGTIVKYAVDITGRKEALTAVRESEARLAAEAQALARLNELSERLWQAPGIEEGLDEMLEGTISLLDGDKGNIQLLDNGRLQTLAEHGFDPKSVGSLDEVGPSEDAAYDGVLRTHDVMVIEDMETDQTYAPLLSPPRSSGYRAVTSAPLIGSEGTVLGVLSVYFASPHRPGEQDLDRLRLYTRLAASFIERQRTTVPLRELGRTLMMAEQEERRRIGQFLHDDLQQLLFGIQLRLESLTNALRAVGKPELSQDLREALHWIGDAIASTRELSVDLVPPVLQGDGLAEALEWLASRMSERHQLEIALHVEYEDHLGGENKDVLLFQVVRELLFNVVKHAGVLEATVMLHRKGDSIEITVSDEGVGFDLDKTGRSRNRRTGLGLFSVRERIRMTGGTVEIDTAPDQGTRIRITTPLSRKGIMSGDRSDPKEAP